MIGSLQNDVAISQMEGSFATIEMPSYILNSLTKEILGSYLWSQPAKSLLERAVSLSNLQTQNEESERLLTADLIKKFILKFHKIETITGLVLSFLTPKEVESKDRRCKVFQKMADSNVLWREFCLNQGFLSQGTSAAVYKTHYRELEDLFSDRLGKEFYREHLGEIKSVSPIPLAFIQRAHEADLLGAKGELIKDNYQLLWIPKEITMVLPSGLILNEQGRLELMEDVSLKEAVSVPMTLNNLGFLMEKCLKDGKAIRFSTSSYKRIFVENGDKPIEAHWSYQRREIVGRRLPYSGKLGQVELATKHNLEIVSLTDRLFFNFMEYIRSGSVIDKVYIARTSTAISRDRDLESRQAAVWTDAPGQNICYLNLFDLDVGVAVGLPSENLQNLGVS